MVENPHIKAYERKVDGERKRRFEIRLGDLGSAVESIVELSSDLGSVRGSSFDMRASHYQQRHGATDSLIVGKRRRGSNTVKDLRGSVGSETPCSERGSLECKNPLTTDRKSASTPSDMSSSNHTLEYNESFMYRLNDGVTPNWAGIYPSVFFPILSFQLRLFAMFGNQ